MNTVEIYVKGNAHIPHRFYDYALWARARTEDEIKKFTDLGFQFTLKDTDLFKSLDEEAQKKVQFLYVNGIKGAKYGEEKTA